MTVIERLKVKKKELENKHNALTYSSIPKIILRNKIDILSELINAYGSTSAPVPLTTAQQTLNQQVGFEEQKRKILESLEIAEYWEPRGIKKSLSVLCLVGPPGVGKSAFAQIISQALGKKIFSVALGGLSENSILIGSEANSPVNSMGQLAKALVETKTCDPVILLDEIDKTGSSLKNCLLSVLDPTQNQEVLDYYLEIKLDFSQVTFVLTANDLKKIPKPLHDRMLIVELSEYNVEKKKEIANKIIHKWFTDNRSLSQNNFKVTPNALETLISKTNEKGVRQLKMALDSIFDYCLLQWAREARQGKTESKIVIGSDLVNKIIPGNFSNIDWENEGDNLANLQKEVFDLRGKKDKLTNILASNNQSKVKIAKFHALSIIQQRLNKVKLKKEDLELESRDYEEKINSANSCEDIEIIREETLLKIERRFTLLKPKKSETEKDELTETESRDNGLEKQLNDLRQILSSEIEKLKKQLQSSQKRGKFNWSIKGNPWFFLFVISLTIGGIYGILKVKNYNQKRYKTKK